MASLAMPWTIVSKRAAPFVIIPVAKMPIGRYALRPPYHLAQRSRAGPDLADQPIAASSKVSRKFPW